MSSNGDSEPIVNFDALEAEGGEESPADEQKLKAVLTFLKDKLEAEDYGKVLEGLGVKDEMTNAELFAAIKDLVKPEEEGDEKEEEKDAASYKDFMKKCMEGGKSLKECGEEYKEKYPEPEPKKEEIAEVEQLAETLLKEKKPEDEEKDEKDAVISDLQKRLKALEDEKELSGVTAKVDTLIKDKHLAPVQRDLVIKLSAKLNDEDQTELLELFEKTQKFSVHQDVGHLESGKPGSPGGAVLTLERKEELLELHGLGGLIADKADKTKLPWGKERNN